MLIQIHIRIQIRIQAANTIGPTAFQRTNNSVDKVNMQIQNKFKYKSKYKYNWSTPSYPKRFQNSGKDTNAKHCQGNLGYHCGQFAFAFNDLGPHCLSQSWLWPMQTTNWLNNVAIGLKTTEHIQGDLLGPLNPSKNIATGETSQAITPFHFFDYFHFFDNLLFFNHFTSLTILNSLTIFTSLTVFTS